MSRTQRLFRIVWRVNAIFILVAGEAATFAVVTLAIDLLGCCWSSSQKTCGSNPTSRGASDTGEQLFLGSVSPVPGTMALRGELQARCRSSSLSSRSGPYGEVRNILFVAGQGRSAHWLLPDNGHVITEQRDIAADDSEQSGKVPVATVVLVKPAHEDLETAEGKLFLLAPSGGNVQTVATGVRQLHTAAVQRAPH